MAGGKTSGPLTRASLIAKATARLLQIAIIRHYPPSSVAIRFSYHMGSFRVPVVTRQRFAAIGRSHIYESPTCIGHEPDRLSGMCDHASLRTSFISAATIRILSSPECKYGTIM